MSTTSVFGRVGFFIGARWPAGLVAEPATAKKGNAAMSEYRPTAAREIAEAVLAFQQQTTGHTPGALTVVLGPETLAVTLHAALSPAERDLARSPSGAAKVREFHQQLFCTSCERLRRKIEKITGAEWRRALVEVEPATGDMVQAFAKSDEVQLFCLAGSEVGEAGERAENL
ncbi:MAG: DUF2294 family protein [Planctomycetes bacterium]|nr:DUF2294 family protein [Planctomycetota bacterium]